MSILGPTTGSAPHTGLGQAGEAPAHIRHLAASFVPPVQRVTSDGRLLRAGMAAMTPEPTDNHKKSQNFSKG